MKKLGGQKSQNSLPHPPVFCARHSATTWQHRDSGYLAYTPSAEGLEIMPARQQSEDVDRDLSIAVHEFPALPRCHLLHMLTLLPQLSEKKPRHGVISAAIERKHRGGFPLGVQLIHVMPHHHSPDANPHPPTGPFLQRSGVLGESEGIPQERRLGLSCDSPEPQRQPFQCGRHYPDWETTSFSSPHGRSSTARVTSVGPPFLLLSLLHGFMCAILSSPTSLCRLWRCSIS